MSAIKRWYAVYTRPRWEKKVHRLLEEKGIESYCPLNKVRKKWSDRYKTIEEPLFKSYVFVRILEEDKTSVRTVNGVVNFVYWLGKPAIVKDKEIEVIKLFTKEYEEVDVERMEIKVQEKARVKRGILMDHEGKVIQLKGNYAYILIESLGFCLKAQIRKTDLEPLSTAKQSLNNSNNQNAK